jgi:hypothetical protein
MNNSDRWVDPIVAEIHAVREQIARKFDYDLHRIVEFLREEQTKFPGRVVTKEDIRKSQEAALLSEKSDEDAACRSPG